MTSFYKLARPMMRGVVLEINFGNLKGVKNRMVLDMLVGMPQFKGELVVGKPIDPECKEITELLLQQENLIHPFVFWVYDIRTTQPMNLRERLILAESFVQACGPTIQYVDHELIESREAMDAYAEKVVKDNFFPGVVLREPFGTYGTEDEEVPSTALGLQLQ